jgi:hypothetical protein
VRDQAGEVERTQHVGRGEQARIDRMRIHVRGYSYLFWSVRGGNLALELVPAVCNGLLGDLVLLFALGTPIRPQQLHHYDLPRLP